MRDILLTLLVFGALPLIVARPYIGVLFWSWIGYMSPHRHTWGFAYALPFAQLVGIATIVGFLFSKKKNQMPWNSVTIIWLCFVVWTIISTIFSLYPDEAFGQLSKVLKIQLMSFLTILLIDDRKKLDTLVWVIVISLGFYGVKGGIWTALTGGHHRVLGPEGSFIAGNTEIGLAMVLVIPLMRYLHLTATNKWMRRGLMLAIMATALAVLGTHSRGALLGLVAAGGFLFLKSQRKAGVIVLMVLSIPILLALMPQAWFERMDTMQNHEQDGSAMERIYAWRFSYKLALARPIVGGGFKSFTPENYRKYAPDVVFDALQYGIPEGKIYQNAHSIYLGTLGHLGFVGLALFLLLGVFAWKKANLTIKIAKEEPKLEWAGDLARMLQVSLVGYATAGAFLSLENFDLAYHIVAMVVVLHVLVHQVERPTSQRRVL